MKMLKRFVAVSLLAVSCAGEAVRPVFENVNFQQTLDVTGSFIKRTQFITVRNTGSETETAYLYAIEPELAPHVSVLEVHDGKTNAIVPALETSVEESPEGARFYRLAIPPLGPNEQADLIIAQAITGLLEPLPESAKQEDPQYMSTKLSRYPYSAYTTKEAVIRFKTPGRNFEDLESAGDIPEVNGAMVKYGPYKAIGPYSANPIKIRFENPLALVKTTKLDRDVWVSHWGNSISFEETYWLTNFGTKLKDSFSRLRFQRPQSKFTLNVAALKELAIKVGPNAREPYYTDLVGNVSTSRFRNSDGGSLFEIKPRYPVFGGWNYNYTIGWSQDLDRYVKEIDSDVYLLKVPFIEGPDNMYYDEVNISIILPQGAQEVSVLSLFGNDAREDVTYSFLDSVGRPTIRMGYENIIDSHRRGEVYIQYKYTEAAHLSKPLSISGRIGAVFLVLLIAGRLLA
ncbi:dolichyl-diphosphooligosaccharide--protein glycosyltransferase subunit 1 [Trichomonascus vanleenenianus]|uniref:dolichyl-diphosphooligosaccharide--protein glycotransferase subunit OST1 n=1 Tax=Trichomonascus vanleenenianus TaxID=2268995 RepID=UPI003ECA485A